MNRLLSSIPYYISRGQFYLSPDGLMCVSNHAFGRSKERAVPLFASYVEAAWAACQPWGTNRAVVDGNVYVFGTLHGTRDGYPLRILVTVYKSC